MSLLLSLWVNLLMEALGLSLTLVTGLPHVGGRLFATQARGAAEANLSPLLQQYATGSVWRTSLHWQ